jgi:hypothetical protein
MALRNADAKAMTFVQPSTPVLSHKSFFFPSVLSLSFNVEVAFSKDISAPWQKKKHAQQLITISIHGFPWLIHAPSAEGLDWTAKE